MTNRGQRRGGSKPTDDRNISLFPLFDSLSSLPSFPPSSPPLPPSLPFRSLHKNINVWTSEYSMIYRGPGFLAAVWFGSTPNTPPPLSRQQARPATHRRLRKRDNLLAHRKGGGSGGRGRGAESYDPKKARPSINHSILSGLYILVHYIYSLLTTQCRYIIPGMIHISEHKIKKVHVFPLSF